MKAKHYADLLTLDQGNRPNWLNLEDYAKHETWSYKCWAWHFLQRNPLYQETSIKGGPTSGERARRFGRSNLKAYKAAYSSEEDDKRSWLAERVSNIDSCQVANGSAVTYALEFGEVAFVIDLRQSVRSGRAAITSIFMDARSLLDHEFEKFEKALKKSGGRLPEIVKPRRNQLLPRLRMCDAMWKRASDDELIRVFFPGYCIDGMPVGYQRGAAIRKVRALQSEAIRMMEEGYLELIPLHHIQDKSSKKMPVHVEESSVDEAISTVKSDV
jgi:hypothetical protein